MPVDWTGLTNGWVEGEYITTSHGLALAAGENRLAVGWRRPASGERTGSGIADALQLKQLLVIE